MSDTSIPRLSDGIMLHALKQNWWLILLRGICAVIFGLLTFVMPGITLLTLALVYGAYAIADGVLALVAAVKGGGTAPRWWLAVVGLLGIGAGAVAIVMPGLTALVLLYMIAVWAVAIGVMQVIGAIRLRREIENEWMLIGGGVLSVLFGLVLLIAPGAGALGLLLVIGAYAVIYGVTLIGFALRLRRHGAVAA
jgi:uncharacterized membrane protein HdeD (DUF308 family)